MKEIAIPPKLEKIRGPREARRLCGVVLGSVLTLLPLLLAALTMEPYGIPLAACLAALWWPMERAGLRTAGIVLIVVQDIALRHGNTQGIVAALLCVALAGEMLLLNAQCKDRDADPGLRRLGEKLRAPRAFFPGLALGAALMMALYQCSGYFAVGASGAGIPELLRSYRCLGFHPNWRTVLFSTVMLVILITWPRKFKKLSRVLPGNFVGLVVVTVLNLILNPDPLRSAVLELPWGRVPVSALSMALIFAAWEEIPWSRVRECFRSPIRGAMPMALVVTAMLSLDLLWVLAAIAVVSDALCAARFIRARKDKKAVPA